MPSLYLNIQMPMNNEYSRYQHLVFKLSVLDELYLIKVMQIFKYSIPQL